eukprot:3925697-Amphidinium_carterae.2
MSGATLDETLLQMAQRFLDNERYEKVSLESTLLSVCGQAGCILYLDSQSYDETRMMLAAKLVQHVSSDVATQESNTGERSLAESQTLTSPGVTLARTKLLQIKNNSSLLVSIDGTPCLFMAEVFNPLVAMTQCTAKNMLRELMQLETVSKADSGAQTIRLASAAGPLPLPSRSHSFQKTMQLVDNDVSSLIKLALSIREGATMKLFRQALAQELHGRELIFVPAMTERAEKYKEHILQLVAQNKNQSLPRAALLLFALSGDWRNRRQLEYVVATGTRPPSKSSIKDMMVRALLLVMVSTQPPVFLRHRWNGSDQAIGFFILISAVHNLLLGTYQHFLALVGPYEQGGQDQLGALADVEVAAQMPNLNDAPIGQDNGNMYAALNAQHRKDSHTYVLGDPLPHLLAMQIIVLPMSVLFVYRHIYPMPIEAVDRSQTSQSSIGTRRDAQWESIALEYTVCWFLHEYQFSLPPGAMENSGDPPGTKRNAHGKLVNAVTGRFVKDPTRVPASTSRRASGKRSVSASTLQNDRSRSLEELSDPENQQRERSVLRSTHPDSAAVDVRHRLNRKTTVLDVPKVAERPEYERVQAQLRQGDPIRLDQAQGLSQEVISPPLLSYLTQGREESGEPQTPNCRSKLRIVNKDSWPSSFKQAHLDLRKQRGAKLQKISWMGIAIPLENSHWQTSGTSFHTREARTVGFRSLIYKLLSRAGSAVYQLISMPHKLCPLSLFQVLEKQEVNDALLQLPTCMKDSPAPAAGEKVPELLAPRVYVHLEVYLPHTWARHQLDRKQTQFHTTVVAI